MEITRQVLVIDRQVATMFVASLRRCGSTAQAGTEKISGLQNHTTSTSSGDGSNFPAVLHKLQCQRTHHSLCTSAH